MLYLMRSSPTDNSPQWKCSCSFKMSSQLWNRLCDGGHINFLSHSHEHAWLPIDTESRFWVSHVGNDGNVVMFAALLNATSWWCPAGLKERCYIKMYAFITSIPFLATTIHQVFLCVELRWMKILKSKCVTWNAESWWQMSLSPHCCARSADSRRAGGPCLLSGHCSTNTALWPWLWPGHQTLLLS